MQTATETTNGTTTKARKVNGFKAVCPYCGDAEATVRIDINNLRECQCGSCDAEFSPADAVAHLAKLAARWKAVARWTEMAGQALAGLGDDDATEEPFA